MSKRVYLSEASKWWSIARQREVLADVLPGAVVFQEGCKGSTEKLTEMLRAASRKQQNETVYLASLAVVAERETQFLAALDAAAARGSNLVSLSDPEISLATWKEARRHSRLEGAALLGAKVSAARRKANSQAAVDRIKDRWRLPSQDYPTRALLEEAGVSRNTVNTVLGFNREQYQARHQAALKRRTRKVSGT